MARWCNGTGRGALDIAQRPVPLHDKSAELGEAAESVASFTSGFGPERRLLRDSITSGIGGEADVSGLRSK